MRLNVPLRRPRYGLRKKGWGKLFENKELAFLMAANVLVIFAVSIPGWKLEF